MLTTCRLSLGPGCGQHAAEQHSGRQLPLPFPARALPRGRNRGLEGAERSGWAGLPQGSRRAEASRAEAGAEGASGHLDVSDENTPQRGSGASWTRPKSILLLQPDCSWLSRQPSNLHSRYPSIRHWGCPGHWTRVFSSFGKDSAAPTYLNKTVHWCAPLLT